MIKAKSSLEQTKLSLEQTDESQGPEALNVVRVLVEGRLSEFFATELARWMELDANLSAPLRALHNLVLRGGKRLRPALCYWSFVGCGGDPEARVAGSPSIVDAGAALEMLQAFALIHDDIMDGSARRRGEDAVHVQFEQLHEDRSFRGEARRFGEGVAILIGDLAFVYADALLGGMNTDADTIFSEMRLEVNLGQYLDVLATAAGDASRQTAKTVRVFKSGKYTVERPLHLGAALAGRLHQTQESLSAFGLPLGEAFQLRDDLLGAFGDPLLMGKNVGEDLRDGKPTLLYALARERADESEQRILDRFFGRADLDTEGAGELQRVLSATGAKTQVEGLIADLIDNSIKAIQKAPLSDQARYNLGEIAHFIAGRSR